jgi:integrase/recombinase XerD
VPRYIRPEEVERLRHALTGEGKRTHKSVAKRDTLLLELVVKTGLRRSELAALKVGEVDLEAGIVRVEQGKGGKQADLPLAPSLVPPLREFTSGRGASESLFGLRPEGISSKFKAAARRAGVNLTPHQLRHHFVEQLLERGVDIRRA